MAMSLKPQKAQSKKNFMQNIIIIGAAIGLLLIIIMINASSSAKLNDVVEIAVLKTAIAKNGTIRAIDPSSKDYQQQLSQIFEKQTMLAVEYEKANNYANKHTYNIYNGNNYTDGADNKATSTKTDTKKMIILWDDLKDLVKQGAYANLYIPAGRPLYFSDFSRTKPEKTSYLYSMDGELVRLDVVPDDFGDMVVPGDKLNIRITYTTKDLTLPTYDDYKSQLEGTGVTTGTEITVTEMLFSEVAILDMVNKKGESIFDLYYELLTLPNAERETIINSDDFKSRVKPSNILLSVTAEEADRYAKIKNMNGQYLITLLPRDGTSDILDALDELQTGFARK